MNTDKSARTPEEKAFVRGAACALAILNRNHDQPTMVAEVLVAIGVTTAVELGRHGVDRYDIDGLRDALKYLRRRGIATSRQRKALSLAGVSRG
jgi:hypothetical protein